MLIHRARQLPSQHWLPYSLAIAAGFGLLLGVACLWLSPVWVLAGVLSILFFTVIACKPELGLLVIVLITAELIDPESLPLLPLGSISLHITDIILLYLLALVIVKALVRCNFSLVRTPLDIPLIWFCIAILFSTILALTQPSAGTAWVLRRMRPLTYYLCFFAVTNLIRDRRQLATLVNGLFAIAALASLATIAQVLIPSVQLIQTHSRELVTAGQDYSGVVRTFTQAIWPIYMMFMVSVCSLMLKGRWLMPTLEFARVGVLTVALFLSFTRNLWLTSILMLVLLGLLVSWYERIRIARWVAVGVVAVALIVNLLGISASRYLTAAWDRLVWGMQPGTLAQDSSAQMRLTEISYGLQSIAQHPLLGIGLGNFYRPSFRYETSWGPNGLRWYIHNSYLWVWIDMGVIGLVPFIWLFVGFLMRGFAHWRKIRDAALRAVALGSTLGILGLVISNFVVASFVQSWNLAIFSVIMGVNQVILTQSESMSNLEVTNPKRID